MNKEQIKTDKLKELISHNNLQIGDILVNQDIQEELIDYVNLLIRQGYHRTKILEKVYQAFNIKSDLMKLVYNNILFHSL